MYICNNDRYGYILSPLEEGMSIQDDVMQLKNVLLEASGTPFRAIKCYATLMLGLTSTVDFPTMEAHPLLTDYVTQPTKDKLGFDEIFLINLERRPDRRLRMEWSLNQLGLEHKLVNAVDGK